MSLDLPGFADPVAGAQTCFRALLDAMARPGRVRHLVDPPRAPAPMDPATGAVLLTLIDAETTVYLGPAFATAADWVAFHCGTRPAPDAAEAMFIASDRLPDLSMLNAGTDEAPESGSTIILQVAALGSGRSFRLDGPGLRHATSLLVSGLPGDFADLWQRNCGLFPRGVDLILCAGDTIAALPRTVRMTEE